MFWLALPMLLCATPAVLPPVTVGSFGRSATAQGWPGWGAPAGPAKSAVELAVIDTDAGRAGRLRYRGAYDHVLLPLPAQTLQGSPQALTLRVRGDRGGALLSASLADVSREWFNTDPLPLNFEGWRNVRLDLTRIRRSAGGNHDQRLDPPLSLVSLNLEFAGHHEGELLFADLRVEQRELPAVEFLSAGLESPARIYLPGDRPPAITVVNHAPSSIPVVVAWRLGEQRGESPALLPAPDGGQVMVRLEPQVRGPLPLEITLRSGEAERSFHTQLALLPPRAGGPDSFLGLGDQTADDLGTGRMRLDLAQIRGSGADWTLLSLPSRAGEGTLAPIDWELLDRELLLAWGQGLRVTARIDPSLAGGRSYAATVAEAESRCEGAIRAWVVAAPGEGERYADRVAAVRAALTTPRPLLAEPGPGAEQSGADGLLLPLAPLQPPSAAGMPRAWTALQAQTGRAGRLPVWLWAPTWPVEALSGTDDRAAAVAIMLACARATPGVVALGWGQLHDQAGARGLLAPGDELRPEYLAMAVSSCLLGGLRCHGVRSPAPDIYVATFGDERPRTEMIWSEGAPADLSVDASWAVYDMLGRQLRSAAVVKATRSPLYLTAPS